MPTVGLDRPAVNVDDSAVLGLEQTAAAALLRTAARDGPRSRALIALLLLRALRLAEALALDVRRLARDAGLPNAERVHPHALRHTAVTLALDTAAQLVDVQDMAGHSDPRTTRRYDRARGRLDRDPTYTLAALLDTESQ